MTPWLTIIGLGEDGLAGLSSSARALLESAELVVGGARHLTLAGPLRAERLTWATPLSVTVAEIARWRPAIRCGSASASRSRGASRRRSR